MSGKRVFADLPFFPPIARCDGIPTSGASVEDWIVPSLLESFLTKHDFSSFWAGVRDLPYLEILLGLGYSDDEIGRRIDLLKQREANADVSY